MRKAKGGTVVLDQSCELPSSDNTFGMAISESDQHKAIGQTFTVGVDGILDHIELLISEQRADSRGPLAIDIRPANPAPVLSDGAIFFGTSIEMGELPDAGSTPNGWIPVYVRDDTARIHVRAGDQLAIVLRALDAGFYGIFGARKLNGDFYPYGSAYWRHDNNTDGQWQMLPDYKGWSDDFCFRTYVDTSGRDSDGTIDVRSYLQKTAGIYHLGKVTRKKGATR
jgi:hypothetical protein